MAPLPVIRALSRALDALGIDSRCGTLLLQCVSAPLPDTLKYTYTALYQFLDAQNVPELPLAHAALLTRRTPSDAGQAILKHIQSVATQATKPARQAQARQRAGSRPCRAA